jgi:hypothetical protein
MFQKPWAGDLTAFAPANGASALSGTMPVLLRDHALAGN